MTEAQMRKTSYHEAGHTVACLAVGYLPTKVEMIADDEQGGQCAYVPINANIEADTIVALAGVAAEARLRGVPFTPGSMRRQGARGDLADAKKNKDWAKLVPAVAQMIEVHWESLVCVVANELKAKGELDTDALLRLLKASAA